MRKSVKFFPSKESWYIKLDAISKLMAKTTVAGVLFFNGIIDYEKFYQSMQCVSSDFDCLFCRVREKSDGTYAEYFKSTNVENTNNNNKEEMPNAIRSANSGNDNFFQCEFEEMPNAINYDSANLVSYLPLDVPEKMLSPHLAAVSLEGLPISAFKLTMMNSFFLIGYRLNHAFFDQSSIVYFFRYLSAAYTSRNSFILRKPALLNISSFLREDNMEFNSRVEFQAATPEGYTIKKLQDLDVAQPNMLTLFFDRRQMQILRESSTSFISENDVLHAIMLKILSINAKNLSLKSKIRLLFARNMRKSCGLDEAVIGNFIRFEAIKLSWGEIQQSSLIELASLSRKIVDMNTIEQYKKEARWFIQAEKYCEDSSPHEAYLDKELDCVVSNWSSFPYSKINFGGAIPESLLLQPLLAMTALGAIAIVVFKNHNGEKQTIVKIFSRHAHIIDAINILRKESGLYSTEIVSIA